MALGRLERFERIGRDEEKQLERNPRAGESRWSHGDGGPCAVVMGVSRTSKMLAFINYRMRITLVDGRQIVGRFMAFDRHMNLVVADAEEHRKLPPKKGIDEDERHVRRVLGFVLIRGEEVVSLTVEGPPQSGAKKAQVAPAGPGTAAGAGRGMPPATRAAPAMRGLGGPAPAAMMPGGGPPPGMRPPGR